MVRMARAASSSVRRVAKRSSCGSLVWSIIPTDQPSGSTQIVRYALPSMFMAHLPLSPRAGSGSTRTAAGAILMALEGHQHVRLDAEPCQLLHAAELGQVDDERGADDVAAGALDELGRRLGRPAGSDQVVDDEDALARPDGVIVHLDDVDAVLQRVFLADGLPGQLAFLAQGHEAASQPIGDGAAQDEPARLDAGNGLNPGAGPGGRHLLDGGLEALRVAHERGYVAEHDPLLGIIRDGADQALQVWHVQSPRQLLAGAHHSKQPPGRHARAP